MSELVPTFRVGDLDVPDLEGSVSEWQTSDGRAMFGLQRYESNWVVVENAAAFEFGAEGEVWAVPENSISERALDDLWRRSVLPLVVQARGTQVLHASAVRRADGAIVALCGSTTAGKSTLAAALMQRYGLEVVADDALAFTVENREALAHPLPFELRLRPESAEALGLPAVALERDAAEPGRLAEVVLLDPRPDFTLRLQAVDDFSAYAQLMPHAYCFALEEGKERLVHDYAALLVPITVLRLTYPQSFDGLDATLAELDSVVMPQ